MGEGVEVKCGRQGKRKRWNRDREGERGGGGIRWIEKGEEEVE